MAVKENKIVTSKYTLASFLPLNLYRQFSKYSNVFFFVTLMLLLIPAVSPFPPYAYLTAFLIVIGISIFKDGIEDIIRHKQDRHANERIIHKIMEKKNNITEEYSELDICNADGTNFMATSSYVEDLRVGNVIILRENEEVPSDIVLLNAKVFDGKYLKCRGFCFIQTSSLDGEANLKKKQSNISAVIDPCGGTRPTSDYEMCECDKRIIRNIRELDISEGGIDFNDISAKIKFDNNVLLQTEKNILLRGTHVRSTDQILGLVITVGDKTKISKNQHKTDLKRSKFEKKVERKMFYIFILYFIILFTSCTILTANLRREQVNIYEIDNFSKQALKLTGTNYILYSYLIPLSLFVMIEVARIFQKNFVSYDPDIKGAYCRNSNVTEDIGMIDIILSDKTGTLTENKMNFRYYDTGSGLRGIDSLNMEDSFFFVINLLCNNELQLINNKYEGISQDEISIVERLESVGCFLRNKADIMLKVEIANSIYDVKVLAVLEFNSERQRMSTLVQINTKNERFVRNNDIYLFTKGSDQRLNAHLSPPSTVEVNSNYRSLLVVHRKIEDANELNVFLNEYHENMLNPKSIERLFEGLEKKLRFAGIAYIEDRIGFKVKDTVEDLKEAGIKIWMVTGDKKETALSCGRSVGIVSDAAYKPDEIVEQLNSNTSLPMNRDVWMERLPDSLIIYRAIPDKKAIVAKELVKRGLTVLAIGDGNNDVSMINASTVGVGIRGKEGGQAALAGDFAVMSFHHLRKLLFHHGKNNLVRFSKLTINSFFKNIFLITFQFNYNFSNGFSGLSAFNYYFLNYFNILFTSFIPFTIAIFDRGKEQREFQDQATERRILESYKQTRDYFSTRSIIFSMSFAVVKGCLLYWVSFAMLDWNYAYMTTYFSYVVFISTFIFQVSLIEFFNVYTIISMVMTTVVFAVVIFGIDEVDYTIYGNPVFYFTLLAVLSINVGSDLIYKKICKKFRVKI